MSPNQLVVASVIASLLLAPATNAFAQARPPTSAPPAPTQAPAPMQAPAPVQAPAPPPAQTTTQQQAPYPGQYPPPGYPQGHPYYPPPPPPASAVAPNGEYVAPLSQTTQPTYVPQSVALSGPRMIKDWEEGDPIPYGYHQETRLRKGKVIAGSILFGVTYLISAWTAAVGDDVADGGENEARWMVIPVLGPFLTMGETNSSAAQYMLALMGGAQAVGATLLITGLLYPKSVLVRNDLASATVVPMTIGMDGSGLGLVGRF
jgi:hypothetical protein